METSNTNVSVLIVGAGPVGLALAAELQRQGVSALIVERQPAGANTSRACVIHARTLEVLEPLGVTAHLLAHGVKVPIFRVRDRDRALLTIDFAQIDSNYPFTLMYPQNRTERALLAALERFGGSVTRGAEFIGFERDGSNLVATLELDGRRTTVNTRWLIGCDGMHSRVREQADIAFEGADYQQGFVLADVHMDWPYSRDEVTLFYSPAGFAVVAPLPDAHFRIVAMDDAAPATPSLAYLQALLDARGPTIARGHIHDVAWTSRFHLHHRVARTPRAGQVLLCGDAAHVHSPAGGQGMNTGIQDAMSLAGVLASTMLDHDETRLDVWAATRHRVATEVVAMTDRMTRMATLKSPFGQSLRNAAIGLFGHVPPLRASVARTLAELDAR